MCHCLCHCLYHCLPACLSVSQLSAYLTVCLSAYLTVCLPVCHCLSACLTVYVCVCLSVCLCLIVCLWPSVCLTVCLYPQDASKTKPWTGKVRVTLEVDGPAKLTCQNSAECPGDSWCEYGRCEEKCWDTAVRAGSKVSRDQDGWCQYDLDEIVALFGEHELWKHGPHWRPLQHMDNDSPIKAILKSSNKRPGALLL